MNEKFLNQKVVNSIIQMRKNKKMHASFNHLDDSINNTDHDCANNTIKIIFVICTSLFTVNKLAYADDIGQRNEQNIKPSYMNVETPDDIQIDSPPHPNVESPKDILIDRPSHINVETPKDIQINRPTHINVETPGEMQINRPPPINVETSRDILIDRPL